MIGRLADRRSGAQGPSQLKAGSPGSRTATVPDICSARPSPRVRRVQRHLPQSPGRRGEPRPRATGIRVRYVRGAIVQPQHTSPPYSPSTAEYEATKHMHVRIYDWLRRSFVGSGAEPARRWAWDIGIVLLVALTGATRLAAAPGDSEAHTSGVCLAIALGAAAVLLLRRLLPELCLAMGLAASSSPGARAPLIAAAYAVACYGGRSRYAVLAAGTAFYLVFQHLTGSTDGIVQLCHRASLDLVLPAVFGALVRHQRDLNAALRERCARMSDAMDNVTRFALLEERTRIAFDLHDHLGHQATCLALRAGALQQVPGLPAQARQAAEAVLEAARHMLGDLRTLLEAMREGKSQHSPLGPHTSCAEFLATLARNMTSTGMDVRCRVEGVPQLLPSPSEQLLHRACREAFTNIVKHAPGASVDVCLSYQQEQVTLAIRNGLSVGAAPVHSSGKMGLAGLRSRIAAAGGHLMAGPCPDGGFSFQMVLPTSAGREGQEQCVLA